MSDGYHIRPVFRRTGMRLQVSEWLAKQILGSWATSMDLVRSVPTFQVFR